MQRKRRWHWMLSLVDAHLSWRSVLLLRLALLPMALVSACCALSATGWRGYSLASTALLLRFAVMVQAGARGSEALSGQPFTGTAVLTSVAIAATAALAWLSGVQLRKRLTTVEF